MDFRHDEDCAGAIVVESADGSPQRQVFVVDEAQEVRDFIVWLLRSGGYRVLAAGDERVVRPLLLAEHAVLVITEVEIPSCKNTDFLIFHHSRFPEVPVVIVLKEALAKMPAIHGWLSELTANSSCAANFREKARSLISWRLDRKNACLPCW